MMALNNKDPAQKQPPCLDNKIKTRFAENELLLIWCLLFCFSCTFIVHFFLFFIVLFSVPVPSQIILLLKAEKIAQVFVK